MWKSPGKETEAIREGDLGEITEEMGKETTEMRDMEAMRKGILEEGVEAKIRENRGKNTEKQGTNLFLFPFLSLTFFIYL
ncbi:MAG: hypothetical protein PHU28_08975 [Methanosarcinaceae archaeon]|nr:hypothetical protein [Methanosarcinaceae archaeon]